MIFICMSSHAFADCLLTDIDFQKITITFMGYNFNLGERLPPFSQDNLKTDYLSKIKVRKISEIAKDLDNHVVTSEDVGILTDGESFDFCPQCYAKVLQKEVITYSKQNNSGTCDLDREKFLNLLEQMKDYRPSNCNIEPTSRNCFPGYPMLDIQDALKSAIR